MKKLHMVAFGAALLLLISNMAFAAPATTMSKQDAATRARMTLAMKSVDGQLYDVYAISDNEYLMGDSYQWRQYNTYEENWKGNFYLYIANQSDANAMQQRVNLFDEHYKSESNASKFIVNTTYPNYNGFYIVQGKAGMPDVLIHTIRESGGGFFSIRAFVIRDGQLQPVRFMSKNREMNFSRGAGFDYLYYLDDGTFAVPWWSNSYPTAGKFITVYMLDVNNLIFIEGYTQRR